MFKIQRARLLADPERVGDDDELRAREPVEAALHGLVEPRAAILFLALEHEGHIHRQCARAGAAAAGLLRRSFRQQLLHRVHEGQDGALQRRALAASGMCAFFSQDRACR